MKTFYVMMACDLKEEAWKGTRVFTEKSSIAATFAVLAVSEDHAEDWAHEAARQLNVDGEAAGEWETLSCVAEDEDTTRSSDDVNVQNR